jgi:glutaredoxin
MFSRFFRGFGPNMDDPIASPADLAQRLGVPAPDQQRDLVLFKYNSCPFCRRAMSGAEQLGLDLTMRDTQRDRSAASEHYEKTGRSTVPCLYIDGEPLFESADIVEWLRAYKEAVPSA